jgi:GH25 family lysozyme M1 (1,4-beta-N-acetylmuramidase)
MDASHYDYSRGSMDLQSIFNDGVRGFTCKATEGTSMRDAYTGTSLSRARAAGFEVMGAYHVVRTASISAQVTNLLSYINGVAPWWRDQPYWVWQTDLELWAYDAVSARTGINFSDELMSRAGHGQLFMYASKGQYGDQLNNCGYPLWNANYGTNPIQHYREAYPGDGSPRWSRGSKDTFLQYGSRTTMGRQGTCDASAFRGTLDQLKQLIAPSSHTDVTPASEETTMFIAKDSDGHYYLCDGMVSRPITAADANQIAYCSSSGYGIMYDLRHGDPTKNPVNGGGEWEDIPGGQSWVANKRHVRLNWGPSYCGALGAPVTMTPADISAIAEQTAEQVEVGITYDDAVRASKQAAREGAVE